MQIPVVPAAAAVVPTALVTSRRFIWVPAAAAAAIQMKEPALDKMEVLEEESSLSSLRRLPIAVL